MKRSLLLLILALFGAAVAIYVVIDTNRPTPTQTPLVQSATAPFASYVAGTGSPETRPDNVAGGPPGLCAARDVPVRGSERVQGGAHLRTDASRPRRPPAGPDRRRARINELGDALASRKPAFGVLALSGLFAAAEEDGLFLFGEVGH